MQRQSYFYMFERQIQNLDSMNFIFPEQENERPDSALIQQYLV
jgi:hypothetical protein